MQGQIVDGRWVLGEPLGKGGFGVVYSARHLLTGDKVAVKFERVDERFPQLKDEAKLYKELAVKTQGRVPAIGVPSSHWHGLASFRLTNPVRLETYKALVLDQLGPSLWDRFLACEERLSMHTIVILAVQILNLGANADRLEFIHDRGIIHRDVKPENLLTGGRGKEDHIYLVDFGLSKRYATKRDRRHCPLLLGRGLTGTSTFTSLATHMGMSQSRRDDLETLGFVLVFLATGTLPWENLGGATQQANHDLIKEKKHRMSHEHLCDGLPIEFVTYLKYVRGLKFDQKPDYNYVRKLFQNIQSRERFPFGAFLDWQMSTQQRKEARNWPLKNVVHREWVDIPLALPTLVRELPLPLPPSSIVVESPAKVVAPEQVAATKHCAPAPAARKKVMDAITRKPEAKVDRLHKCPPLVVNQDTRIPRAGVEPSIVVLTPRKALGNVTNFKKCKTPGDKRSGPVHMQKGAKAFGKQPKDTRELRTKPPAVLETTAVRRSKRIAQKQSTRVWSDEAIILSP